MHFGQERFVLRNSRVGLKRMGGATIGCGGTNPPTFQKLGVQEGTNCSTGGTRQGILMSF